MSKSPHFIVIILKALADHSLYLILLFQTQQLQEQLQMNIIQQSQLLQVSNGKKQDSKQVQSQVSTQELLPNASWLSIFYRLRSTDLRMRPGVFPVCIIIDSDSTECYNNNCDPDRPAVLIYHPFYCIHFNILVHRSFNVGNLFCSTCTRITFVLFYMYLKVIYSDLRVL